MISALIDVPRTLDVGAWFVGIPRGEPLAPSESHDRSRAGGAHGTAGYRQQAVRECLDIVGVLREYRPPQPGETWLIPAASERRLLAQVNAIIALGPDALEQVSELAMDPDVADPSRVFASLFVLGCTAGSAWVRRIGDIFVRTAARDAAESSAAIEACGVSPSPDLDAVLQSLCEHEHPRVRAAAVRACAFRDSLPESHWQAAMQAPEPEVVIAAMQARLGSFDRTRCGRALEPYYASENRSIARFALRAGLSLRLPSARAAAIEMVESDPGWADAAVSLAMFGYLGDARLVRELLQGPHVRTGIVAAAVLGGIELVPDLLSVMAHSSEADVRLLSAQAVSTITGIPAAEATAGTIAGLWTDRAPSFNPRVRYRGGEPLTAGLLLRLLHMPQSSRRDRQDTYLELLAMTDSEVPRFSPYDFVGVQLQSLDTIERWLSRSGGRP